MKPALIAALAGLVCGALGAGLVVALRQEPPREPGAEAARVAALRASLRELEAEQVGLTRRVRELELATMRLGDEDVATREVVEPMRADVEDVEAVLEEAAGQAAREDLARLDEELPDLVGEIMTRMREQEQAEREERREEARSHLLEERVARLTQELDLSFYQAEEMKRILGEQDTERRGIIEEARENGTFFEVRDEMRALSEATEGEIATILTATQLEGYRDSRWGGELFGRRGPFARDAGGDGGGGDQDGDD